MRLVTSPVDTIRAWPKGFGHAKLGGNYGPTLPAHNAAIAKGFDQVLWLFGDEGFVTEAGARNFFVVWKTEAGEIDLVTAGLDDGLILEGVIRRSVLDAVKANQNVPSAWQHRGQSLAPLNISERNFSIHEIKKAAKEGRLIEAFAAGTAVSWRTPLTWCTEC
jgi:branched-chain amino acid aminotransferase